MDLEMFLDLRNLCPCHDVTLCRSLFFGDVGSCGQEQTKRHSLVRLGFLLFYWKLNANVNKELYTLEQNVFYKKETLFKELRDTACHLLSPDTSLEGNDLIFSQMLNTWYWPPSRLHIEQINLFSNH